MNPVIGKEAIIEVGGRSYKLARLDRALLQQFIDWCEPQIPHPLDALKGHIDWLTPDERKYLIKEASERAARRLTFNSPEVQDMFVSQHGVNKLLSLLFKKHHPELTEEAIVAICAQIEEEHGLDYIAKKVAEAQGELPVPESERERQALEQLGVLKPSEKKG